MLDKLKGMTRLGHPSKVLLDKTRYLGLAQNARYFGAARRANALCETTTIGFFHVSGKFTFGLALNAICLTGVTFLRHGVLLLSNLRRSGGGGCHPRGR